MKNKKLQIEWKPDILILKTIIQIMTHKDLSDYAKAYGILTFVHFLEHISSFHDDAVVDKSFWKAYLQITMIDVEHMLNFNKTFFRSTIKAKNLSDTLIEWAQELQEQKFLTFEIIEAEQLKEAVK